MAAPGGKGGNCYRQAVIMDKLLSLSISQRTGGEYLPFFAGLRRNRYGIGKAWINFSWAIFARK
jgi:hypothetical protein